MAHRSVPNRCSGFFFFLKRLRHGALFLRYYVVKNFQQKLPDADAEKSYCRASSNQKRFASAVTYLRFSANSTDVLPESNDTPSSSIYYLR